MAAAIPRVLQISQAMLSEPLTFALPDQASAAEIEAFAGEVHSLLDAFELAARMRVQTLIDGGNGATVAELRQRFRAAWDAALPALAADLANIAERYGVAPVDASHLAARGCASALH